MKITITFIQCMLWAIITSAQPSRTLALEDCYDLARKNYPLIRQLELIEKSTYYTVQNASKGYQPQVNFNGQASYQSEVTQLPIKLPGMNIPVISKDQYKLYGEASQVLYDGGMIRLQQQTLKVSGDIEKQKIEIELYKLRGRIDEVFFGILLIEEQEKQQQLLKKDIQSGIDKANAMIANGTALKSTANVLKAELLKAGQRSIELKATRKAYMDMLGLFIKESLDENTVLIKPSNLNSAAEINRPELKLYDYQNKFLDTQSKLIRAKNLPRINLFLQAGAGRPALNFLSNDLEPYYIGGLRVSWSLGGRYTVKNDHALIAINRKNIDIGRETFLLNTNLALQQQNAQVRKLEELITSDVAIIDLRASIKNASSAQLANGVITTSDYLREVNAEDQAKQDRILHDIQLLMAQYSIRTTTGN